MQIFTYHVERASSMFCFSGFAPNLAESYTPNEFRQFPTTSRYAQKRCARGDTAPLKMLIILFLFLANIESSLDFNLREAYMSLLALQMGF